MNYFNHHDYTSLFSSKSEWESSGKHTHESVHSLGKIKNDERGKQATEYELQFMNSMFLY